MLNSFASLQISSSALNYQEFDHMATPCHIIVEGNPAIIYASREGSPAKILPRLQPFLSKFWQERDISGEYCDTPECLLAQLVVRFGFEMCEDDFSHLRVGLTYRPEAEYLYYIATNRTMSVWTPRSDYRQTPSLGLQGCQPLVNELC